MSQGNNSMLQVIRQHVIELVEEKHTIKDDSGIDNYEDYINYLKGIEHLMKKYIHTTVRARDNGIPFTTYEETLEECERNYAHKINQTHKEDTND